jgi:hypothetical protein
MQMDFAQPARDDGGAFSLMKALADFTAGEFAVAPFCRNINVVGGGTHINFRIQNLIDTVACNSRGAPGSSKLSLPP